MFQSLASLKPSRKIESELDWYYNVAPGEMGIASNFGAQMDALKLGTTVQSSSATTTTYQPERCLEAAQRNRGIYQALQRIDPELATVLEAAYTPRQFDRRLVEFFGHRVVGVAPYVPITRLYMASESNDDGVVAFILALSIRGDTDILTAIRVESRSFLQKAQMAYEKAYR